MNEVLTLFELNSLVHEVIEDNFDEQYWVVGELSDVSTPAFGGHFYGELVQKDEESDRIVARARITCWARNYNMIRLRFQKEAGETLRKGLQVKLLVEVNFHEQYGYSLNVVDIDSTFTLGDLAKRRREILQQLEKDGILHDNQSLPLPRLLKRIAVISSATAAGYGDFCNQLEENDYGFHFDVQLFPAVMQGEQVPESIIAALEEIREEPPFDLVVIIRGGGASSDLSDFDSYELAACIALYPIEHQAEEAALLDDLYQRITHSSKEQIQREKQRLEHQRAVLPLIFMGFYQKGENRLVLLSQRLSSSAKQSLEREKHSLQLMQQRLNSLDPRLLLKRGYTITTCGGKLVRSIEGLAEGEVLTTQTNNGDIYSKVILIQK